jgi:hypothetical protein
MRGNCPDELMELLAAIEHDRWSRQACTALNKLTPERRTRWGRLAQIAYSDLDEHNKDLDRMQVREYWPLISAYSAKVREKEPATADGYIAMVQRHIREIKDWRERAAILDSAEK